ncbi:MAG: lipid A export permease/ATP-binding protein MsbA [Proteobacteria bacterium]|nr:lipid A export permease/ATP-binding protein MsbA [Pseudomonadota bacterium]MBU1708650.1 lipid A export permease/ATP-binding protein MsbA [Pseudomonadota bacterium]
MELVKPYWFKLGITMICMVIFAGLSTTQAYIIKPLLDKIFVEQDASMLKILPLALVLLFIVKGIFQFIYSYMMEEVGFTIIKNLRVKLFEHVMWQPLPFFHKNSTGELVSRIMNDVGLLQNAVSSTLVTILRDFFRVIGLLGYVLYQDWKLSLLSFIFLPLTFYSITMFGKSYRRYSIKMQEAIAMAYSILNETLVGSRIVKAFTKEKYEVDRFAVKLDEVIYFTLKDAKMRSFARPLMEVFGGLGIALIMWYGGGQVLKGASTPGTFFSFLAALVMLYEPIKNLSGMNNAIQQGAAAAERVFAVLDMPGEREMSSGTALMPDSVKQIEFRDVSFNYDEHENVLEEINLTVKCGEIVAIVGISGGGKTTLVNLVPRFYDLGKGSILVNGQDIRSITLQSLRSKIAIVSQETILFNDTVYKNIAYGDMECTEDQVIAAAESAYALDFIKQLPEGFETIIGESGSRLSGGQRQRLSIARALLKNAPILILDEATSALDTEAEREVQKALDNLMKNRTTFVIAHRLSTIKKADRILVIQGGRIVEQGSHEQLLEKKGVYERLHKLQ